MCVCVWNSGGTCLEELQGGVYERKQVGAVGGAHCRQGDMGRLGDKLSWVPGVWNEEGNEGGAVCRGHRWAHHSSA